MQHARPRLHADPELERLPLHVRRDGRTAPSNGSTASITAFRSSTLTPPTGATRTDVVTRPTPVPTFSQCRSGAETVIATDTSWWDSTTNGTLALTVPAQVFGAFSIANGSTGSIGRTTF